MWNEFLDSIFLNKDSDCGKLTSDFFRRVWLWPADWEIYVRGHTHILLRNYLISPSVHKAAWLIICPREKRTGFLFFVLKTLKVTFTARVRSSRWTITNLLCKVAGFLVLKKLRLKTSVRDCEWKRWVRFFVVVVSTRWFKYDRDDLCVNKLVCPGHIWTTLYITYDSEIVS